MSLSSALTPQQTLLCLMACSSTPPCLHLLVLSSEGSWLGRLRQLPIVIGELVGQYAQFIRVGGGFGDLPMEEEQELEQPCTGTDKHRG